MVQAKHERTLETVCPSLRVTVTVTHRRLDAEESVNLRVCVRTRAPNEGLFASPGPQAPEPLLSSKPETQTNIGIKT